MTRVAVRLGLIVLSLVGIYTFMYELYQHPPPEYRRDLQKPSSQTPASAGDASASSPPTLKEGDVQGSMGQEQLDREAEKRRRAQEDKEHVMNLLQDHFLVNGGGKDKESDNNNNTNNNNSNNSNNGQADEQSSNPGVAAGGSSSNAQQDAQLEGKKPLVGEEGGHWAACTHLQRYGLNFDQGLARFLAAELRPDTALEFGCGIGLYIDYLCRKRALGVGIGMEPQSMVFEGSIFKTVNDLTRCPAQLTTDVLANKTAGEALGTFDLVYSIEVAEHIPIEKHPDLVDFLTSRAAKWLVFGAAHPGQGGTGHISERERSEWRALFEGKGFVYMEKLTEALQMVVDAKNVNHKANTMVFRNPRFEARDQLTSSLASLMGSRQDEDPRRLWPVLYRRAARIRNGDEKCE